MSLNYTYSSYFNPIQQLHEEDEQDEDEEYIDMEITSFYTAFLHHNHHHHQSKDFEFPLHTSGPLEPRQLPATSPADELFFNGKLLPLQPHPNRDPNYDFDPNNYDQSYSTPLANTPFQSCNVSPATSCHVSRELTPEDYFSSNGQEIIASSSSNCTINNNNDTKRSNWAKKLKLIKPRSSSLLTSKIKASKSYLKSLFGAKSNSSKINDNYPSNGDDEKNIVVPHRKSFSGAFRLIKAKTVSSEVSSSSSSSSGMLKRSNSLRTSEIESSVDGAIAHCKQSQSHRALRSWKNFGAIRFEACQE